MAGSRKSFWDLSLEIAGKDKGASQAIRTIKKQLEDLKGAAGQLNKDFKSFTANATKLALGVAGGVAAATAGVVSMANSFAETGDKVAKTSDRLGIGIEAYQGLSYAMQQSGLSAEEFDSALEKFNLTVRQGAAGNAAAAKQLQEVGLSAQKLAGMKPEQAMERLSDYMKSLPNDAERTRVAVTLFGKAAGSKMMAAMKQGSAGMQALMKEAKSLGIVLSEEQARQSESFISSRDRLTKSVTGMKNQFIGGAIGPLTEAFDHLKDAVVDQMPAIQELGAKFGKWLGDLVKRLPEIIAKIKEFGTWVKNTANRIAEFAGGWKNIGKILAALAIAPTLISGLKTVWSLGKFIKIAMGAIGPILTSLVTGGFAPMAAAALPIIGIIAGIAAAIAGVVLVVKNWEKITAWMKEHKDTLILVGIAVGTLTAAIIAYNVAQAIANAGGIVAVARMGAQAVATGALAAATGVWNVVAGIGAVATTAFGAAMAFLTSPITLVILAIGAVIAIVYLLIKHWDKVKDFFGKLWEGIKNIFTKAFDWLKDLFFKYHPVGIIIKNWDKIKTFFVDLWEGVKGIFIKVFDWIKNIFFNFTPLGIIIKNWSKITEFFSGLWNGIKDVIGSAWEGIKNFFGGVGDFFSGVWGGIKDTAGSAWGGIKDIAGKAWEGIKSGASKAGNFLKKNWKTIAIAMVNPWAGGLKALYDHNEKFRNFVDNTWGKIKNVLGAVWDKMPDGVKDVFIKIKDTISGAINSIKDFFTGLWAAMKQGPTATIEYLKNAFFSLFDSIKQKIESFVNFFKEKMEGIKNFFGGVGDKAGGFIGGAVDKFKSFLPGHAEGGIFRQPHIAQVAERGAEAIVPLNKTSQGFDIWKQAGELGGYLKRASEQTATMSAVSAAAPAIAASSVTTSSIKEPEPSPIMAAAAQRISGDTSFSIEIKMTNNFSGGTPGAETIGQLSDAGQKISDDIEAKLKSIIEKMARDSRRVSYGAA